MRLCILHFRVLYSTSTDCDLSISAIHSFPLATPLQPNQTTPPPAAAIYYARPSLIITCKPLYVQYRALRKTYDRSRSCKRRRRTRNCICAERGRRWEAHAKTMNTEPRQRPWGSDQTPKTRGGVGRLLAHG